MIVTFSSGFEKDLSHNKDKILAKIIFDCINLFENAIKLSEIPNIKKLKGDPFAYRYRKGKYRVGFYFDGETIEFAAFDNRGKIYDRFP